MITNATIKELDQAMKEVNKLYDNNIIYNRRPDQINTNRIAFTIRCKDSKGSGARISPSSRRMISACWHVHGKLFDILFDLRPDITIRATGKLITIDQGNWLDKQIGSYMDPFYYSESCNC